jgi:hypothetical protein
VAIPVRGCSTEAGRAEALVGVGAVPIDGAGREVETVGEASRREARWGWVMYDVWG